MAKSSDLQKVDAYRERISHLKNHFTEFNIRNIQFPMVLKVIPKTEQVKLLNIDVFQLMSSNKV